MTSGAVLIDTDVFSVLFTSLHKSDANSAQLRSTWSATLAGCRPVISFQTRAESLAGAHSAQWGTARLATLRAKLDVTPTIDADRDVIHAYATLVAAAKQAGHPLGNSKQHNGDRWIAACAIAKKVPLLTGNLRHFRDAPGLELISY